MTAEARKILTQYGCETQAKRQSKSLNELYRIMVELEKLQSKTWEEAEKRFDETGEWNDTVLESVIEATSLLSKGMNRARERFQMKQRRLRAELVSSL